MTAPGPPPSPPPPPPSPPPTAPSTLVLRNARLADGRLVDVTLAGERIAAVRSAATGERPAVRPGQAPPAPVPSHDLGGKLLLPAPAEPHAHLDKAFTADRVPNPAGDLAGAIAAMQSVRGRWRRGDIEDRAERAARALLVNGCTAIRTHADLTTETGTRNALALVAVRERLRGLVDVQVVALVGRPLAGEAGRGARALLDDALDGGVDAVGGAPYLDDDPVASYEALLAVAAERDLMVDMHADETLDPAVLTVRDLARLVRATGFGRPVAASHCVSLGVQSPGVQAAVADELAEAGIAVVALPQTNLFLQARGVVTAPPRGLTAIAALRAAGVTVAGGADNLQDPFNLVGRADPLETAALLVMAGHVEAATAYEMVSNEARRAMGLEPVVVSPGFPAELVAVDAPGVRAAVAGAPAARTVIHRGRVVATTTVSVVVAPPGPAPGPTRPSDMRQGTDNDRSLMVRAAQMPRS